MKLFFISFLVLSSLWGQVDEPISQKALDLILDGSRQSYEKYADTQRLSYDTFKKVHQWSKEIQPDLTYKSLLSFEKIYHLEGGLGLFTPLKALKKSQMQTALFLHVCQIPNLTETTYRGYEVVKKACERLYDPKKTELDAFQCYLEERGRCLGLDSIGNPVTRILIRLGAMLDFFNPEEGQMLVKAFDELSREERESVILCFDPRSMRKEKRMPSLIPDFLRNLFNNPVLGKTKEERLQKTLTIGLPIIAKTFKSYEDDLNKGKKLPTTSLDFTDLVQMAKAEPLLISKSVFQIDESGCIFKR